MFDARAKLAELLLGKFGNLKVVMSNHDGGILTSAHFLGIRTTKSNSKDSK